MKEIFFFIIFFGVLSYFIRKYEDDNFYKGLLMEKKYHLQWQEKENELPEKQEKIFNDKFDTISSLILLAAVAFTIFELFTYFRER